MASLNVAEWSPDQVEEWLSGLGPTVARYAPGLRERGLDGAKLLMLRCDDLEYLGMHIIGHQELILEAVDQLRNFQYEARRECVQQLAARASAAATNVARALAQALARAPDARLDTQTLADVAATVRAVKPLVCWLDRCLAGCGRGARGAQGARGVAGLAERKAQLLQLALEAATCAQRDRFAHQPARAVAAAAHAAALAADYIVQEVCDPMVLQPASLDAATLRQGGKPLGFDVVPSFCGHHQLADIRFGSPAHASGHVHDGDEIVQVGDRCVIGWSGAAVLALCEARARSAAGELPLRLRRRAARPPPAANPLRLRTKHRPPLLHTYDIHSTVRTIHPNAKTLEPTATPVASLGSEAEARASSSSDSEALSPPASPHLPLPHPPARRVWGPLRRRHTVAGAPPRPPDLAIHQFWRELREHCWERGGSPAPALALYRRDKAVSCSTGLELSPRPRTCGGVPPSTPNTSPIYPIPANPATPGHTRGRLDKSYSTPEYASGVREPTSLHTQPIPESPTPTPADSPTILVHSAEKADQILEFKKSSSQIGEAILQQRHHDKERLLETINIAMMEHRRRSILELERRLASDAPLSASAAGEAVVSPIRVGRNLPREPPAASLDSPGARREGTGAAREGTGATRGTLPVLRAVPRPPSPPLPRPTRLIDVSQISLPLRHITKHDIRVICDRREMPPINASASACEPESPSADARARKDSDADVRGMVPSPMGGGVKSIFPTSKSRSLKKKNSILAKRRCVPLRTLAAWAGGAGAGAGAGAGGARAGAAWQRVRARQAQQPRWARRHLLLTNHALYAYRNTECSKADCMINLEGFTACAAGEVKSRAHAFKVYHTGTAFYFAADSADEQRAWIAALARAALAPPPTPAQQPLDISQQFSETDYSDTESDSESCERRERERREEREREKDKSKFGSLKKLTGRMQRSESQENVGHSTSLDRKYLRFFSRNKTKDDSKPIKSPKACPVATEQYRSYRRAPAHASTPDLADLAPAAPVAPAAPAAPAPPAPAPAPAAAPARARPQLTLEEFMLAEQEDTKRQMYTDRVVLGVQAAEIQRRMNAPARHPPTPTMIRSTAQNERSRPRLPTANNGMESPPHAPRAPADAAEATAHERWRDSLRRNHKVHSAQSKPAAAAAPSGTSWSGVEAGGVARLRLAFGAAPRAPHAPHAPHAAHAPHAPHTPRDAPQYPHLQCPPTFQPESYSLARLAPPAPPVPPVPPATARAPPPPPPAPAP